VGLFLKLCDSGTHRQSISFWEQITLRLAAGGSEYLCCRLAIPRLSSVTAFVSLPATNSKIGVKWEWYGGAAENRKCVGQGCAVLSKEGVLAGWGFFWRNLDVSQQDVLDFELVQEHQDMEDGFFWHGYVATFELH
jgi:hypothetical protein